MPAQALRHLIKIFNNMHKNGFTFIEVLVVSTIIGLLAAIGMVSYNAANKKSRDGKRKADIEQIRAALEMYRIDCGAYPAAVDCEGSIICSIDGSSNTYLNPIPCDPKQDVEGYGYIYNSDSPYSTYTITALLEDGTNYEKTQP